MSRSRLLALVAVLLALGGAVAYSWFGNAPGQAGPARRSAADLAPLRARAALAPCPRGISVDLPDLVLPCLGGGPDVPLRGVPSGLPTLVNVYGSWCTPCQEEMPILARFAKQAAGRVALVGVDTVDDPRLALLFAKDVGQTWPAVVDDNKSVLIRYASGPPVTLFVDSAGRVVHVTSGAFRSLAGLEGEVRRYLGVTL